jgi:hypothetical protein
MVKEKIHENIRGSAKLYWRSLHDHPRRKRVLDNADLDGGACE